MSHQSMPIKIRHKRYGYIAYVTRKLEHGYEAWKQNQYPPKSLFVISENEIGLWEQLIPLIWQRRVGG